MTAAALVDSYYEASVQRPPATAALAQDTSADVCVIGGGYTGLSCALELAQAGKKVVLLEFSRVGWGASGRNGGQIIHGYSTGNLAAPAAQAGVDEKYLFDLSLEAMRLLRRRVREFNINCDLRDGYMHAALHARHCRELEQDADVLINRYRYPVRLLDLAETRENIASRRYCGALVDDNSGHLHPLKYLLGLAAAAAAAGVQLYENTKAVAVAETAAGARVRTAQGTVRCQQVVLAGNAYLDIVPQLRARVMPVGTYIGATGPLGSTAADNLITAGRGVCDANFVLDYFRCSADTRLLFGGRVSYSNQTPKNLPVVIRRRMEKVFPQLTDVPLQYVWGGSVAITISRFPDIGRQGRTLYYAHGFSGHGVALSGYAGKVLAEALLGDSGRLDVFGRVKHKNFIGGRVLRAPLLVLAMLYYRLRDLLG